MTIREIKSFYLQNGYALQACAYATTGQMESAEQLVLNFLRLALHQHQAYPLNMSSFQRFCNSLPIDSSQGFCDPTPKKPDLELQIASCIAKMPKKSVSAFCEACYRATDLNKTAEKLGITEEDAVKEIMRVLIHLRTCFLHELPTILRLQLFSFISKP